MIKSPEARAGQQIKEHERDVEYRLITHQGLVDGTYSGPVVNVSGVRRFWLKLAHTLFGDQR